MKDRDPKMFTLWWVSGDKQSSLWGGDYPTFEEAVEAQPEVEKEFRDQCSDDCPYDEDSDWTIQTPEKDDE